MPVLAHPCPIILIPFTLFGKITMNGKEYTNEEFQKIMPNIHVPKNEHHEQSVRDITGKLRINGMTPDDYRKKYESQKRVIK